MLGITDFWTYVLGTAAIVLLPGPNSIFVLTVGAQRGVRAGYRAAAGVFIGDAVLMALAAAGVASLLRAYPPVFMVIKYAGAAYLAWVGLGIIRGAWRKVRDAEGHRQTDERKRLAEDGRPTGLSAGLQRPFRRALVVSLLNPKAILFVVSFFIQFVEPGYAHPALSFLVLGAVLQVFSALYLTALIFGGQFLAGQFRRRRRLSAGVATGVGAVFVGFGVKLATATTG
ncbi:leucine efflux protein LeuE [Amorphoplanes nipponensis]|uniref:Leucine efflux protein n=1 Tax=Actinoplanes nipponensis TaxID=135950 RepID=A0A919MXG3_9ACTN|nr:leucine efflux protein [Actinoplanes nipponensis]